MECVPKREKFEDEYFMGSKVIRKIYVPINHYVYSITIKKTDKWLTICRILPVKLVKLWNYIMEHQNLPLQGCVL